MEGGRNWSIHPSHRLHSSSVISKYRLLLRKHFGIFVVAKYCQWQCQWPNTAAEISLGTGELINLGYVCNRPSLTLFLNLEKKKKRIKDTTGLDLKFQRIRDCMEITPRKPQMFCEKYTLKYTFRISWETNSENVESYLKPKKADLQ